MTPKPMLSTTCPYCGVGCGVRAPAGGGAAVQGDQQHPANHGKLCVKGSSLHETLVTEGRLLHPQVQGQRVSWDSAIAQVAGAIQQAVATHGPGSVGFYLSGQMLTEDYYVANKLAKGFIGTPHVDTNSRLCMSSAVAAHKRAFGEDVVPGCYEDLALADLLVLTGSNTAWNHPILYQRMKAAARPGRKVVVIDPRATATTELADLHLKLRPGSDSLLFNGLLVWLADHQAVDTGYLADHCDGFDEALAQARAVAPDLHAVAEACDLAPADLRRFYEWFAATPRTVTLFSQGINQSVAGTDKGNAIINCHLATGRVGKPGASPFSITGQPNAMGGREVGGLANTLAAHRDYDDPADRAAVADFWGVPQVADGPGYKAVDLFQAMHRGEIKVLWVMATNPAVSLPDSAFIREALARCPTVIVSDCSVQSDTARLADILLPAAGWGEKDGTVTNSERRVSRQRAFLPLPAEVRPDWWALAQVGQALGYGEAFAYDGPADIFREHARLSARNSGTHRYFDLSALQGLSDDEYHDLSPVQWPVTPQAPMGTARLFGDGRFATPSGRARLLPITWIPPQQQPDVQLPLVVNSGRIRDQWHTMTRTGTAPRLLQHRSEPFIDVHPADAAARGLQSGSLATLQRDGQCFTGRVIVTDQQRPGEVFVPIHWNGEFASSALASSLMAAVTDPVSGQPESKHGVASLQGFPARWHARLLQRREAPRRWRAEYWARVPQQHCESWWLAGTDEKAWDTVLADWLGGEPTLMLADPAQQRFRAARLRNGQLQALIMVEPDAALLPDTEWLDECFAEAQLTSAQRRMLLAGRRADQPDVGAMVCSCFQVGEKQIQQAISAGACSVEALGEQLRCGTNCGSCLPELKGLLLNARSVA